MTLFRQTYRVQSTRLAGWDYRAAGHYFVTISTKNREPIFGNVTDGQVVLSPIGNVVANELRAIETRRRNVELDEWVVMPNHLHAILVLKGETPVETPHRKRVEIRPTNYSSAIHSHSSEQTQRGVSTTSRLLAGSLGAIIGQFKSRSSKRLWREGFREFGWQPRFYDHIIRNEESLTEIRQYIIDNPLKWDLDKNNVENLYM